MSPDQTLEDIQDAVEMGLESVAASLIDNDQEEEDERDIEIVFSEDDYDKFDVVLSIPQAQVKDEFEVVYSNGVLTMVFPPHGTWVLNKQTPNRQIWWSSPISGPRRYDFEDGQWIYSRDSTHSTTLQQTL
eukprot:CAMPEP_0113470368 /NCGR_PEP_ID=MMETSP0014_2-20120614/16405_1 /TAXON_ID=2857 /ORGANISM="Nitzschia sp." /LENGTH=130 /DNA_ID=CAMNT_0000362927 /DNA_START=548 /DNA_END=936 /DNA_ORIENTATION=- /assembly_acc=CAM_ASM_000159